MQPDYHRRRAAALMERGRWQMAIAELQAEWTIRPDDPSIPAMMSSCLIRLGQPTEAVRLARESVSLWPDYDVAHACLGRACLAGGRFEEAGAAAEEALRLNPNDPDYHALMSSVHYLRLHYQKAIAQAEQGLTLLPTHGGCLQIRSRALWRLGQTERADATLGEALADNPLDAHAHSMSGWSQLDQGHYKQAQSCFLEALRIDPEWDEARVGLLKSLKSRFWPYRMALKLSLWKSKLKGRNRAIWLFLGFFLLLPLSWAVYMVLYLTWIADPVFNLLLLAEGTYREVLTTNERRAAILVVGLLAIAAVTLATVWLTHSWLSPAVAVVAAGIAVPANLALVVKNRWERIAMAVLVPLTTLIGILGPVTMALQYESGLDPSNASRNSLIAFACLVILHLFLPMPDSDGHVDL